MCACVRICVYSVDPYVSVCMCVSVEGINYTCG